MVFNQPEAIMARKRHWTLREDRSDYFNSKIRERFMLLELDIRRLSGKVERVGTFRFDMEALASRGLVNRHDESGGPRYVIQINHINGRDFNIGVRARETEPLTSFLVS